MGKVIVVAVVAVVAVAAGVVVKNKKVKKLNVHTLFKASVLRNLKSV